MSYPKWNQRVFNRVFNPEREGKTTSVYIDEDILYSWAVDMGLKASTPDDALKIFVQDCLKELRGDATKIATYCYESSLAWNRERMEGEPSYMAMLALLVLASTWGQGQGNLFYQRYWGLTGTDRTGMIPSVGELRRCWKQLQQYSEKHDFKLGIYKVRTLAPSKVNVGVIVAQGVLRPSDTDALKDIFFDEGADANVDYSDQHFKSWLEKHATKLSTRARKALTSDDNADYLISRVREELDEWDGEPSDWSSHAGRTRTFKRLAYLCFNKGADGVSYATIRLDFAGRSGDPEMVIFGNDEQGFIAHSNGDAVSTTLETAPNSNIDEKVATKQLQLRNPADFQKFKQGEFRSTLPGNSYRYSLIDKTVRVFVEGHAYGVDGYIETQGLRPGYGHIVIFRTNPDPIILRDWCDKYKDEDVNPGRYVPTFFSDNPLWSIAAIRANAQACPDPRYDCLQYEVRPLARPSGGLKLYKTGNTYLEGCPPFITINSRHKVTCSVNNGTPIEVEGLQMRLDQLKLSGTIKLTFKEEIEDGKESELNIRLLSGAEWSKDRDGDHIRLQAAPNGTPDYFAGYIGWRTAAYGALPDDCDVVNACWTLLKSNQVMPCASVSTINSRIRYMNGTIRQASATPQMNKAWKDSTLTSKLHPVCAHQPANELWKLFTSKAK